MKNILWFWSALLAFAFLSCSDNQDQLKSSIIKMNERCPVVEENWTVDSLGISKEGDIVYFCNSTNNADYMISSSLSPRRSVLRCMLLW